MQLRCKFWQPCCLWLDRIDQGLAWLDSDLLCSFSIKSMLKSDCFLWCFRDILLSQLRKDVIQKIQIQVGEQLWLQVSSPANPPRPNQGNPRDACNPEMHRHRQRKCAIILTESATHCKTCRVRRNGDNTQTFIWKLVDHIMYCRKAILCRGAYIAPVTSDEIQFDTMATNAFVCVIRLNCSFFAHRKWNSNII